MILLKIGTDGVFSIPFECQAPRAVDVNRVADGLAPQTVKVETGNTHVLGPHGRVQARKSYPQAFDQIRPNFRRIAGLPQGCKRAAAE